MNAAKSLHPPGIDEVLLRLFVSIEGGCKLNIAVYGVSHESRSLVMSRMEFFFGRHGVNISRTGLGVSIERFAKIEGNMGTTPYISIFPLYFYNQQKISLKIICNL